MSFDVNVGIKLGTQVIECHIEPSDGITVLFGHSGAGKTSVLNMISGLLEPGWGHITVGGRPLYCSSDDPWEPDLDIPASQRRAGYVFQEPRLFPHLRVRDNLTYGNRHAALDRVAFLGIDQLLDRWPRSLSGGEAKRVAIGRALLSDPDFLLLDEPLSSLDRARREEIMAVLERLRDEAGIPILMVTHDAAEAERLAGAIVEIGN